MPGRYNHLSPDRHWNDTQNSVLTGVDSKNKRQTKLASNKSFGMNVVKPKTKITVDEQKRRQKQSKKDKNAQSSSKFKVEYGEKRGKLNNRKALKVSWMESVLAPFRFDAQRGPSDFLQPTAIFTGKNVFELQPPKVSGVAQNCLYMIVHPHFHNGAVPFSGMNVDFANVWYGENALPTSGTGSNFMTLPGTSATSLLAGFGSQSTTVTNARFVSYRVTQLGIRIIPDGANLSKQGNITMCMIPGKSFTVPGTYVGAAYPLPSTQTLRQYPSSYEVSVATLGPEGTQFVWLPLDPMDYIFLGGAPNLNTQSQYAALDDAMLSNYFRNPIHILFDGINGSTDKFRIVIKYGVEYVPTGQFEPFVENRLSDTNDDVRKELKDKVRSAGMVDSVSGGLGDRLSKAISDYGFLAGPYRPYVDLAGEAIRRIF